MVSGENLPRSAAPVGSAPVCRADEGTGTGQDRADQRDLPALWAAGHDTGRRLLTEALFEKVAVLGVDSVTHLPDA